MSALLLLAGFLLFWLPALPGEAGSAGRIDYGHVRALALAKVRFLGQKPAVAAELSPSARLLWQGDTFGSPSPADMIWFQPVAVLGCAALAAAGAARLRRGVSAPHLPRLAVACLVLVWGGAYLLVARLASLATVPMAVAAGVIPWWCLELARRRRAALLIPLALAAWQVDEGVRYMVRPSPVGRFLYRHMEGQEGDLRFVARPDQPRLLDWIRTSTPPEAVFLGPFNMSAYILSYAGRGIVINPKYEDRLNREKSYAFTRALFGSEAGMLALCRRWNATHLIYEAGALVNRDGDSPWYVAGQPKVDHRALAYRLHLATGTLAHLRLAYQDGTYRVFEVRPREGGAWSTRDHAIRDEAVYDAAVLGCDGVPMTVAGAAAGRGRLLALRAEVAAFESACERSPADVGRLLARLSPPARRDVRVLVAAARARMWAEDLAGAEAFSRAALRSDPGNHALWADAALFAAARGDLRRALEAAGESVRRGPGYAEGYVAQGAVLKLLGRGRKAEAALRLASARRPSPFTPAIRVRPDPGG